MNEITRCAWVGQHAIYLPYHDQEWGVPLHDDQRLFEMLCLEGAQAGLTWLLILSKREHYRRLFHGFDPARVAAMTDSELEQVLLDPGIVRNRLKVYSVRKNALAFLKVVEEFGSFDRYLWGFVGGQPIINAWSHIREVPARTAESDAMSKDLKKRGFSFVGSTICYALMQATGMVNDHTTTCFCYQPLAGEKRAKVGP
jgi:DNA-3-methyladenine glycosylase I